ncbi:hypothetical protein GBL_3503 [Geobacillus kaustophilus GBlys]|uniref:Uncharacterized protein n=1 Tax=Geobacillus kaustophilus GBlys TaxID=1337888 RepID=U2WWP0_GEOKU|nr:hypothetical protein GBL_3503 [Geobacillus kaustophilus GBlys]GAJ60376.1 hypothetical protein B23_3621 [Geobacillus thermoleovorans B23]
MKLHSQRTRTLRFQFIGGHLLYYFVSLMILPRWKNKGNDFASERGKARVRPCDGGERCHFPEQTPSPLPARQGGHLCQRGRGLGVIGLGFFPLG